MQNVGRLVRTRTGAYFFSVNPAISDEAAKRIRRQVRSWRLHRRSGSTLGGLAREINPIVRGWINYYGRFYKSELVYALKGHQPLPDALGHAEVQTTTPPPTPGLGTAGIRSQPVPEPVRPLAIRRAAMRPGDGSRVNREVYARF